MSHGPRRVPVLVRLAAKIGPHQVVVPSLGPCWPFAGARTPGGHGVIRDEAGKVAYAHRIALMAALGRPLRPGMFANHRCDYAPCVRPAHLYEGTKSENEIDKRRGSRPPTPDTVTLAWTAEVPA